MMEIEELIRMDKEIYDKAKKSITEIKPCQQCGWCCNNKRILVTIPEIIRILKHTKKKFSEVFVIEDNKLSISIKTKKIDSKYYCIFYDNGKCTIHDIKPFQCFTYPIIFHPAIFEIHPPKSYYGKYYVFTCQSPYKGKAISAIEIDDFELITTERLLFLTKNYDIQKKLISKNELAKVVEGVAKIERT